MDKVVSIERKDEILKTIGINLKYFRENKKYNQKDVAEKIGCSCTTYNYYENGKREIGVITLMKLAKLYNVPTDVFFQNIPITKDNIQEAMLLNLQKIADMKEQALKDNLPIGKRELLDRFASPLENFLNASEIIVNSIKPNEDDAND